jgi:PmbA protein
MISNLLNILKNDERLFGWNIKVTTTSSYQLFFIRQQLDMNREVVTDDYDVTIFIKEENRVKTKVGSASFKIYSTMSEEEVKAKIDEQIILSKYTLNQGYNLPKKVNLKPVTKEKSFSGYSLKEAAFIAADALFEADKYHDGYINSSEIFIDFEEIRFFDSNGNVFLYTKESGKIRKN